MNDLSQRFSDRFVVIESKCLKYLKRVVRQYRTHRIHECSSFLL